MKGHLIGSDKENIIGRTTFQWLEGGFFLQQDVEIDFAGISRVAGGRTLARTRP